MADHEHTKEEEHHKSVAEVLKSAAHTIMHPSELLHHKDKEEKELKIEMVETHGVTTEVKPEEEADDNNDNDYDNEPWNNMDNVEQDDSVLPPTIARPADAKKTHMQRVTLLYNPKSGNKSGEDMAEKAIKMFDENGVTVSVMELQHAGHAEELCRTLDLSNTDALVILGGDGTFHESINGMMKRNDEERKRVPLALIAGGTGNSFALELQGGVKVKKAVKHILRGVHCPIDICKVEFPEEHSVEKDINTLSNVNNNGSKSSSNNNNVDVGVVYSFNSIHWGLGSRVNVTAEKLRWMGKAIRYTSAALFESMNGTTQKAKVVIEDKDGNTRTFEDEYCLAIANNILSAAKGMKMAPDAKINDGLIDLLLIRSSKAIDLMTIFKRLYEGTHTELPYVDYMQVKSFSLTAFKNKDDEKEVKDVYEKDEIAEEIIDIDGELKGRSPFKCTMLPRAVRVIV